MLQNLLSAAVVIGAYELRFDFQKFRILEILNFHPCYWVMTASISGVSSSSYDCSFGTNFMPPWCSG